MQGSSSIRFRLITTLPRHGALYSFANLVVGTRLPLRPSATCELLKGVTVHPTCTAPSFCTYRRPVEVLYLLHLTCLHPYHILQATNSYARLLPSPGLPASQPASQPARSCRRAQNHSWFQPCTHLTRQALQVYRHTKSFISHVTKASGTERNYLTPCLRTPRHIGPRVPH